MRLTISQFQTNLRIPVTSFLNLSGNSASIESTIRKKDADYLVNRNAFLVIKQSETAGADADLNLTNLIPGQSFFENSSFPLSSPPASDNASTCRLSLHSDPEGALIYVNGTYLGKTTPLTVEVNTSDQHGIRLEARRVCSRRTESDGNE